MKMVLQQTVPLDLWSYLLQQVPVVVVLGVFCFFLYKLILKRDAIIKEKDEQLAQDRKEVMELYGEAIKSANRTTEALNRTSETQVQLIELIKDVREDIMDLRELIHNKQ